MIPKYDGPFKIVKRVGAMAYKLKLPERLQIHTTIYMSFLKPYYGEAKDLARNEARQGLLSWFSLIEKWTKSLTKR